MAHLRKAEGYFKRAIQPRRQAGGRSVRGYRIQSVSSARCVSSLPGPTQKLTSTTVIRTWSGEGIQTPSSGTVDFDPGSLDLSVFESEAGAVAPLSIRAVPWTSSLRSQPLCRRAPAMITAMAVELPGFVNEADHWAPPGIFLIGTSRSHRPHPGLKAGFMYYRIFYSR